MNAVATWWQARCAGSIGFRFVDANLRGIGQVMFQDNPLSGALFLAAIAWGAYFAGTPEVLFGGLVGVVVATLVASGLRVADAPMRSGLYGFNGFLLGLALATFITPGPLLWAYVVLGAAVSVVVMAATVRVAASWDMPALTFPFVIVTWLLLLATYAFGGLSGDALPAAAVVAPFEPVITPPWDFATFFGAVMLSISQVFLKASVIASLLFLAGLAVNSPAASVAAFAGATLAVITAHLLGAESDLITGGLLGFSPVLTAVAVATVFNQPSVRVAIYAGLATVFTVVVQAALNVGLTPLAVPALTMPFVLVTWLFLLPQKAFNAGASENP